MIQGAVLGSPISHSLSPRLHMAVYEFLGISGKYRAIDVSDEALPDFFAENCESFNYFSLTMPLKEVACTLPVFKNDLPIRINSANTLVKRDNEWSLHTTDGSGFTSAIDHAGLKTLESTLILGAGGTARAIAQALDGRSQRIEVLARSSNRRSSIESTIDSSVFDFHSWNQSIDLTSYDLIVNTTPAGAADLLAESVPFNPKALFFDVIYSPWPTVLARKWSDSGGVVVNGLELLIYQAIDQLSLVLDETLHKEDLAKHLRKALKA